MAQTSRDRLASESPSAKIWSVYVAEADRQDHALAEAWKDDMNALLIFASFQLALPLYSSPDPNSATVAILGQISLQLLALANGTQPVNINIPADPVHFQPSNASLLCNVFWFLSLAFSLTCALAATLVDQWARAYLSASQRHPAPHKRARIRAYLFQGIQRFGMRTVVETIPTLLHVSLFLFFAGLIEFLLPINAVICDISMAILAVCATLYTVVTLLPIFYRHCPYQTPFTSICWWSWQNLRRILPDHHETSSPLSIIQAREMAAVEQSHSRNSRDEEALRQTLGSLSQEVEFQAFIEGIPGFLLEGDASVDTMRRLMDDQGIDLGAKVIQQLHVSGYLDTPEKLRRVVSCLGATWSILAYCRNTNPLEDGVEMWFGDEALPVLESFGYKGPIIGHYLSSTIASFSTRILEHDFRSAISMEHEIIHLGVELPWTSAEPWYEQLLVQKYLGGEIPDVSSGCIVALGKWLDRLTSGFEAIRAEANSQTSYLYSPSATDELMHSLRSFQTSINEARITLLNNFLSKMLSDFQPFEALSTFYHLVADIHLGLPVSWYNQTRLVYFLGEHAEMPQLAYDHLLDLISVLDDQLMDEAQQIITSYLQLFPDSNPASRALFLLQTADGCPPPASVYDIIGFWGDD